MRYECGSAVIIVGDGDDEAVHLAESEGCHRLAVFQETEIESMSA